MTKTHAEMRFENARKRLSQALTNLENTMKQKLHEEAVESRRISAANDASAIVIEQAVTIQNLTLEINNLQQSLSDLGRETEFLNTKNKIFAEKLAGIRKNQLGLIEAIEDDLIKISAAINIGEDE